MDSERTSRLLRNFHGSRDSDPLPEKRDFAVTGRKRWKRFGSGRRFGIVLSSIVSLTFLLTNCIFTGMTIRLGTDEGHGIYTLKEGECEAISKTSIALHLVVNILSSSLLAASNYTMQYLGSPTRNEVDRAHQKGDWLDIGVPVFRNLFRRRISRTRALACIVLALSTLPIHLLYNSTIFKIEDTNPYSVAIVDPGFLIDTAVESPISPQINDPQVEEDLRRLQSFFKAAFDTDGSYGLSKPQVSLAKSGMEFMEPGDCSRAYNKRLLSGRSDVLLLTFNSSSWLSPNSTQWSINASSDATSVYYYERSSGLSSASSPGRPSSQWAASLGFLMCKHTTQPQDCGRLDPSDPDRGPADVSYLRACLSRQVAPRCKLQASVFFMVAVLCCSVAKSSVMLWMLTTRTEDPLVTMGDAIANFLHSPDLHSVDRCSLAKHDVTQMDTARSGMLLLHRNHFNTAWLATGASKTRWYITLACCFTAIAASISFLVFATSQPKSAETTSAFTPGFGTLDPFALLSLTTDGTPQRSYGGFLLATLVANSPQLLLTFKYLLINGLMTTMLLTDEWSRYYRRKKPLRVTNPKGQQRSTYFLSLPLKYSIPLLGSSTILHWMMSQSIFLARIDIDGKSNSDIPNWLGFSCWPLFFAILLLGVVTLYVVVVGLSVLDAHMPIAGSCSLAIAAACHPPADDYDAGLRPVNWGVTKKVQGDDGTSVRHCSFTSEDVEQIALRQVYA